MSTGFGGGSGESIDLYLNDHGSEAADRLAERLAIVEGAMRAVNAMMADGSLTGVDAIRTFDQLARNAGLLRGKIDELNAAQAAQLSSIANLGASGTAWAGVIQSVGDRMAAARSEAEGWAAVQARLFEMEQRGARETAQAVLTALDEQSRAENAAYEEALQRLARRGAAERQAADQRAATASRAAQAEAAALLEAEGEVVAYEAALRGMADRGAREAAQAVADLGMSTRTTTAAVHEGAGDYQRTAEFFAAAARQARVLADAEAALGQAAVPLANSTRQAADATEALADYAGQVTPKMRAAAEAAQLLAAAEAALGQSAVPLANSSRQAADATEALAQYAGQVTPKMREQAEATRQLARDEANLERQAHALSNALFDMLDHERQAATVTRAATATTGDQAEALQRQEVRTRAAARAFLEFGRGMEDFSTGGFLGVLNNIPTTFANIGQAMGANSTQVAILGGAFSVAGAAAFTIYKNWDKISDAIGIATHAMSGSAERMRELEAITNRTVEQNRELVKLKEQQGRIDALAKLRSTEQKDTEQAVQGVMAELSDDQLGSGMDRITRGLVQSRNPRGMEHRLTDQQRERIAQFDRLERVPDIWSQAGIAMEGLVAASGLTREEYFRRQRQAVVRQAEAGELDRARQDVEAASQDPRRLRGLINEVNRNPGAYPPGLAERLEAATPGRRESDAEEMARIEMQDMDFKMSEDRARAKRKENQGDEQRRLKEGYEPVGDVMLREAAQAQRDGKRAGRAGRRDDAADRAEQHRIEGLARENAAAVQGPAGGQLDEAIARALDARQDAAAIVDRFRGQAAARLPATVADADRPAVAGEIIAQRIRHMAPQVAAQGAGAVVGELQEDRFDRGMNEARGDQRRMTQAERQQVGNLAYQHAINANFSPQQSQAIAQETLNMMGRGFNLFQAEAQAAGRMRQQLARLEAQLGVIGNEVQFNAQRAATVRGTATAPGRRH